MSITDLQTDRATARGPGGPKNGKNYESYSTLKELGIVSLAERRDILDRGTSQTLVRSGQMWPRVLLIYKHTHTHSLL